MLDKSQCSESNKFYNNVHCTINCQYITSVITTESQGRHTGSSKVLWFDVHVC